MSEKETERTISFESLSTLHRKIQDGSFSEILDDWKWIFSYSARYKGAIIFYTFLGVFSTSLGLASSVASKFVIDIITGDKIEQLPLMILIMVGVIAGSNMFGVVGILLAVPAVAIIDFAYTTMFLPMLEKKHGIFSGEDGNDGGGKDEKETAGEKNENESAGVKDEKETAGEE